MLATARILSQLTVFREIARVERLKRSFCGLGFIWCIGDKLFCHEGLAKS